MLDVGNNVEAQAAPHLGGLGRRTRRDPKSDCRYRQPFIGCSIRHLITIGDDYRLIIALAKVPTEFQAVYAEHGRMLHIPANAADRPQPSFLQKHRAVFFAKNGR